MQPRNVYASVFTVVSENFKTIYLIIQLEAVRKWL